MPLMMLLSDPVLRETDKAAVNGYFQAQGHFSYFVSQGVGLVREVTFAGQVVQDFKQDFAAGFETLSNAPE